MRTSAYIGIARWVREAMKIAQQFGLARKITETLGSTVCSRS